MNFSEKVYLHSLARKEASDNSLVAKIASDPGLKVYYTELVAKTASDTAYPQKEINRLLGIISNCDQIIAKCASDIYVIKEAKGIDSKRHKKAVREQIARINAAKAEKDLAAERLAIAKALSGDDSMLVVDKHDPTKFYDVKALAGAKVNVPKHGQPTLTYTTGDWFSKYFEGKPQTTKRVVLGDLPVETSPAAITARVGGRALNKAGLNPSQVKKAQRITGIFNPLEGVTNNNLSTDEIMSRLEKARLGGTGALSIGPYSLDASNLSNSEKRRVKKGFGLKGGAGIGVRVNNGGTPFTDFGSDQTNSIKEILDAGNKQVTHNQVLSHQKDLRDTDKAFKDLTKMLKDPTFGKGSVPGEKVHFGADVDLLNKILDNKRKSGYPEVEKFTGPSLLPMTGKDADVLNKQRELIKHLKKVKLLKRGAAGAGGLAGLLGLGYGGYKLYDNNRKKTLAERIRETLGV